MAVNVQRVVFLVVTPCCLVIGYHQFEGHASSIFMVEVILTPKWEQHVCPKHGCRSPEDLYAGCEC
jgi:hypothetical protein